MDTPAIEDLEGLSPTEQTLLVSLWSGRAVPLDTIKAACPKFNSVALTTLERYARGLSEKLEARDGSSVEFGRTILHGRWCRLVKSGADGF